MATRFSLLPNGVDYAQAGGAQHTLLLAILRISEYSHAYCVGLRNVYDFAGDGEHPSKM